MGVRCGHVFKKGGAVGAGADLENVMTVAHRAWLISRRGQTKEFCVCLVWGW